MKPEDKAVLKVYKGEICYKSDSYDQSFGMWCPVSYDSEHGLPDGTKLYPESPTVAVNEQDRLDAARYRWLFGARTEDECKDWNVGMLPHKPQDLVIANVASAYMPKVAVDGEIDAAIAAAERNKGGV